jgi:hypothetical protein
MVVDDKRTTEKMSLEVGCCGKLKLLHFPNYGFLDLDSREYL